MTVVSDPPSATVVLDGEIDIATCPAIRRFLMEAISGGDAHLAVVMSASPSTRAGSASWSPRPTGRGKREVACRCSAVLAGAAAAGGLSPGRDAADSPALRWPLRCWQRRRTPPPACRQDEGRCGFQTPARCVVIARRQGSCFGDRSDALMTSGLASSPDLVIWVARSIEGGSDSARLVESQRTPATRRSWNARSPGGPAGGSARRRHRDGVRVRRRRRPDQAHLGRTQPEKLRPGRRADARLMRGRGSAPDGTSPCG